MPAVTYVLLIMRDSCLEKNRALGAVETKNSRTSRNLASFSRTRKHVHSIMTGAKQDVPIVLINQADRLIYTFSGFMAHNVSLQK